MQTFSNLVALASLRGWSVHNLSFAEYADGFHHFRGKAVASWPSAGTFKLWAHLVCRPVVQRFVRRALQSRRILERLRSAGRLFDAPDEMEVPESVLSSFVVGQAPSWLVWTAWNLKFYEARGSLREQLTEVFRPIDRTVASIDGVMSGLPSVDRVVGIHVRRGDYATWQGGKYFFSHEQYRALLFRLSELLSPLRVHFLVASNEPVPPGLVAGFSATRLSGNEMEDLYTLARCDLIAGPPSTFSEWSSFYGDVPWFVFRGSLPESVDNLASAI